MMTPYTVPNQPGLSFVFWVSVDYETRSEHRTYRCRSGDVPKYVGNFVGWIVDESSTAIPANDGWAVVIQSGFALHGDFKDAWPLIEKTILKRFDNWVTIAYATHPDTESHQIVEVFRRIRPPKRKKKK